MSTLIRLHCQRVIAPIVGWIVVLILATTPYASAAPVGSSIPVPPSATTIIPITAISGSSNTRLESSGVPNDWGYNYAGSYVEYYLNVASAGSYQIVLNYGSWINTGVNIVINGSQVGSVSFANQTGSYSIYRNSTPLTITLPPGAVTLQVVGQNAGYNLAGISLMPAASACSTTRAPIGINLSGNEYSWEEPATATEVNYLHSQGVTLIRMPNSWEKLQPKLKGNLNAAEVAKLVAFIRLASSQGMQVVVDIHNYARYNTSWAAQVASGQKVSDDTGVVMGSSQLPISAFSDLWKKLATALRGTPGLAGYDLMNEPHDMPSASVWPQAAQAAINAIRSVDTHTPILVEGDQWAGTQNWVSNNPSFPLSDPSHHIVYEGHSYWDNGSSSYSQTYDQYGATPTRGVDMISPFVQWLQTNNAQGYVGEFGVPANDPRWLVVLDNSLAYMTQNGVAGTYWSYGYDEPVGANSWWLGVVAGGGNNIFLSPEPDGSTPPQWGTLENYIPVQPATPSCPF